MNAKAHVVGEGPVPANRLQEWAFRKGFMSGRQFRRAVVERGIMSSGAAAAKWETGRAGSTQYDTLLAVARFLGASRIEDVFDP